MRVGWKGDVCVALCARCLLCLIGMEGRREKRKSDAGGVALACAKEQLVNSTAGFFASSRLVGLRGGLICR